MLLWEGNFIKCLINVHEEQKCHVGNIEVMFRYKDFIVTAGFDGWIRFWDALDIDQCEGDDNLNYYIDPKREIQIIGSDSLNANIISIATDENFWIIQDSHGKFFRASIQNDFEISEIVN